MDTHDASRPIRLLRRRTWLAGVASAASGLALGGVGGCATGPAGDTPGRSAGGASSGARDPLPPIPAADIALANRVTWGATPAVLAELQRLGRDAWLAQQLRPRGEAALPPEVQAQIDGYRISRTPLEQIAGELDALRQDSEARAKAATDDAARQNARREYQEALQALAREAMHRSLLRAVHSPQQLREQLTWFWFNHFNVHQYKGNLRALVGDYEDRAIRPHALGRFRDLLLASATHPAMIRYLDNAQNAANRLNENYAREVMELHTLGVGGGYTQADVQELARVLTGLGLTAERPDRPDEPRLPARLMPYYVRRGLMVFNPARHDMGPKRVLGHDVAPGGLDEIEGVLGRLASHPSTARFVSRKLAIYFVADEPPEALVQRMAATFTRTDGDIAAVMQTLFTAPEFGASLGARFKDPMRYVVSSVRLAYVRPGETPPVRNMQPVLGWLQRLGEVPFNRQTPDGYPLDAPAWSGSGQMTVRFEVARAIAAGVPALFRDGDAAQPGERPALPQAAALANAVYDQYLGPRLGPATRQALQQAATRVDWNTYLLASPEFMSC